LTGDSRAAAGRPLTSFPLGSEVRRQAQRALHRTKVLAANIRATALGPTNG